jgi:hypothetical protein
VKCTNVCVQSYFKLGTFSLMHTLDGIGDCDSSRKYRKRRKRGKLLYSSRKQLLRSRIRSTNTTPLPEAILIRESSGHAIHGHEDFHNLADGRERMLTNITKDPLSHCILDSASLGSVSPLRYSVLRYHIDASVIL